MITGVSSGGLSQIFRQQTAEHSKTLMQIATGKKIHETERGLCEFFEDRSATGGNSFASAFE